jgi:hypothetical protein
MDEDQRAPPPIDVDKLIRPVVRARMRNASEEEITEAVTNLYYFLRVAMRIHDRLEQEGKLPLRSVEDGDGREGQTPPLGQ